MKTLSRALALALLLLLLLLSPSQTAATFLFGKVTVIIQNEIPNEPVYAHCIGLNNDVGGHVLADGKSLTFSFHRFILTKYYCQFVTWHGSGLYGVFTNRLDKMCDGYCVWLLTKAGPCMKKKDGGLYCQDWKEPVKG